eukprot:2364500-Amphidinium_carterae.1
MDVLVRKVSADIMAKMNQICGVSEVGATMEVSSGAEHLTLSSWNHHPACYSAQAMRAEMARVADAEVASITSHYPWQEPAVNRVP